MKVQTMLLSTLLAGVALAGVVDPRASTAKAKGSSKPAAVDKGKGHTATSACHKAMFQAITGKTVKRETDGETDDEPVPFVLSKRAKPPVEMGLAADATAADGLTTTGLATCFGLGLTIPSTPAPLTNKVLAHVNPNGFVGLSAFETKATAAVHAAKQANPHLNVVPSLYLSTANMEREATLMAQDTAMTAVLQQSWPGRFDTQASREAFHLQGMQKNQADLFTGINRMAAALGAQVHPKARTGSSGTMTIAANNAVSY